MKSEQQIRDMVSHIAADERLHYEPAFVLVNAPLALIQTELTARVSVLRWVLGLGQYGGGSAGEATEEKKP